MIVGTVILKDNQLQVVTRVKNDSEIIETKSLEEFISENMMLHYDGDFRTIKNIIQLEIDKYLSKTTVVEVE